MNGLPAVMKREEETTEPLPSGKLLVRMPRTLHAELARAADAEGVSLNQLIIGALSGAVTWRAGGDGRPAPARSRTLTIVLAANLAVLGIAAVVAVAAFVLAWG
jgi:RNA polymerase sigma-B factor